MYFIMHIDFAEPLLEMYPKAAKYDADTLILTGEMPKNFDGEIVELYKLGFNNTDGYSMYTDRDVHFMHPSFIMNKNILVGQNIRFDLMYLIKTYDWFEQWLWD